MTYRRIVREVLPGLALMAFAAGCGGSESGDDDDTEEQVPEVDCSTAQVPAFADVLIWPKCTSCHATTLTGSDRYGAPANINFDNYASATANVEDAMHEVAIGSMPLGATATDEEKMSLYTWGQCGTPQ